MSPKAKEGAPLDAANFQFIFAVLKHNKSTIEPDWEEVARECGISYARNASTKFKGMIKKLGFQLDAGKISLIDESTPASVATTEKAAPPGRKRKTPVTNKKRKITVEDREEGAEDQQAEDKFKMDSELESSDSNERNGDDGAEELA